MAVDEAQGAVPSDLSCFGGKAIAFVALEAVISVIGVDVDSSGCARPTHRNATWSELSGTDRPS